MNYPVMLTKNAFRNRFRTLLTIAGMAVAILAFSFLRTVVDSWNSGVASAAQDRLITRHKISLIMRLPHAYFDRILNNLPEASAVTFADWFGAVYPADEHAFFANIAVDTDTYFQVYPDVVIPPEQFAAWKADPAGAVVGQVLATKYNWKLGDRVTLRGTIYPGDWTFNIRAFYVATSRQFDKSSLFFHWKYLNDGVDQGRKDQIGWLGLRVKDPNRGAAVARAVDKLFESSEAETLTESERAFNLSFMSMYSAVLTALDVVSLVILLIMAMIVGNTIAMGVRERTHEYGVLRAIGFKPGHLGTFVLGESVLIALLGGGIGLLAAVPAVNGFGAFIEDNLGTLFPYFSLSVQTVVLAAALSLLVGLVSAALPAWTAIRLPVTQALRRLG